VKSSSGVFYLTLNGKTHFIMESIRRTEFIVFIINVFDSLNLGRPELHYVDHYDWESPNKKEKIEFKPKDEVMTKTNKRVLNNLN